MISTLRYKVQKTANPSAVVVTSGGRLIELELQAPVVSKSKVASPARNFFVNNFLAQHSSGAGYWFSVA